MRFRFLRLNKSERWQQFLHRCFETLLVCPCLFFAIQLYWNFILYCFYFFQNLRFQIGGAAYLRMRLIHGRLRYVDKLVDPISVNVRSDFTFLKYALAV